MHLLTAEKISKSYTEKKLFKDISFGIASGDKIGLIGANGTGKSTLLRCLVEQEKVDEGRWMRKKDLVIEYLSQEPTFADHDTVLSWVFRGESPLMQTVKAYQDLLMNPEKNHEKLTALTEAMNRLEAWGLESEAKTVLTQLGITDFNQPIKTLSGGMKKRVALASALIQPSDLLILDEPTNHLDHQLVKWLEEYLIRYKGALLMITHDRYFLNRVTNLIFELEAGQLYRHEGSYEYFLERKAEREVAEKSSYEKTKQLFRQELAWVRRGARARTTKQKARLQRFDAIKEDLQVDVKEDFDIQVASTRLGKKILEIHGISKAYGDNQCVKDFSYVGKKGDRIGILGSNGMGKSTLLQMISGQLKPDTGEIDYGSTLKIGYFSQENTHMDDEQRAIDYIKSGGEYVETASGEKITASQMMELFLFDGTLQWTPIGKLSGGEKRRLHLLRVLMEAPNLIILDEPTNDLDIQTLSVLEAYLNAFDGVVIVVSHDRYFLDKVVEDLWVFKGDGHIQSYTGNYTEYEDLHQVLMKTPKVKETHVEKGATSQEKEPKSKSKMSYNEKREWEGIDESIQALEEKIQSLDDSIKASQTDYVQLEKLLAEKEALEKNLEEKMERWVYLSELSEQLGIS